MKRFEKYSKYIIWFVFCVAVIAVYKTFDNLSNIFSGIGVVIKALKPFVLAFVIAYIVNMPAMRIKVFLEKSKRSFAKKHAWGLSVLAVYLIGVILFAVVLWMLIPALYRNLLDLYSNAPTYISSVENYINHFEFAQKLNMNKLNIEQTVNGMLSSFDMSQVGKYAQGVFSVTSGVLSGVVAIIASIYMLIDKERLKALIVRIMSTFLKEKKTASVVKHAKRINDIFTNYIYARLSCSIIMAIVSCIVLSILRVKYALVLGLFVGAMDMIPYFGSIISSVIAILVTLITGGVWKGLWTAIALLVLQQLDGNVLGPKIMGDSLEIRPFWIIFAVSVGGSLFGFVGMLISVPVMAIIKAVFVDYMDDKNLKEQKVKAPLSDGDEQKEPRGTEDGK